MTKFYKTALIKATNFNLIFFISAIIYLTCNSAYAYEDGSEDRKMRQLLVLAGDYWCPYNCASDDEDKGFLVELAARALYIYGIDIEYRMMPWHEALEQTENGQIDGIIGISNIEGRSLVKTNNPIEMSSMHAFTRADTEWVFDGIGSLNGKKLGVIMDYMLDNTINSYVSMNFPAKPGAFLIEDGEFAVVESIANLVDGDADVYIEDKRVVNFYANRNSLGAYIRDAGKTNRQELPVNIAFSSKLPHALKYIKYLEEGIASLKATGEYDDLREKYEMDK